MEYLISEIFTSPQGEGVYTGTMMTFVRLAGCTVGKRYPKELYEPKTDPIEGAHTIPGLPIYTEQCTLYDGRTFPCDTDYRMKKRMTVTDICKEVPKGIKNVCITGGEPAMHNLAPLFQALVESGYWVHIETSGTIMLNVVTRVDEKLWVTVSPKKGVLDEMVQRANEVKLLIDQDFNWNSLPKSVRAHPRKYIQPVNGEYSVNGDNLKLCVELQKQHPSLRISVQLHKVLSEFIKETVR